ncbi:hypothetical protein HMPREF3213_02880 [Heyndrickxia coagulans]|uniref:Uncharacterized protein n=1 Tax=Heyndrickxia coagulans TaxID=1398 RepID=A0A133KGU7_HEYCO|nr:hypothetical protein HMPREF3213_02880 [Heyndrickxia coagulans]
MASHSAYDSSLSSRLTYLYQKMPGKATIKSRRHHPGRKKRPKALFLPFLFRN